MQTTQNTTPQRQRLFQLFALTFMIFSSACGQANAQYIKPKSQKNAAPPVQDQPQTNVENYVIQHARNIAHNCLDKDWSNHNCIHAISESNFPLIANYAEQLQKTKGKAVADSLIEECAAATAGTKVKAPPHAFRSAFTTCANAIADMAQKTGTQPNIAHYQLLALPALCLSDKQGQACTAFEEQLQGYK